MQKIIGHLMYLANNEGIKQPWYALKDKLLDRYGSNDGYDLQYLPGKQCFSCNGTGIYTQYSTWRENHEYCYNCNHGWYKLPSYVVLERIRVGKYVFHRPVKRYNAPKQLHEVDIPCSVVIEGYISHYRKKYGYLAYNVLFLVFETKKYLVEIKNRRTDRYKYWWMPKISIRDFFILPPANSYSTVSGNSIKNYILKKFGKQPLDELPF